MTEKSNFSTWVILSIIIGILVFVVLLTLGPKPIDWSQSYSKNDKIPFGNSILYELLPDHFEGNTLTPVHSEWQTFFEGSLPEKSNFIIINREFIPNQTELENLFELLKNGNSVFIASSIYAEAFADTFELMTDESFWPILNPNDSVSFNFANKAFKTPYGYWYNKAISNHYFTDYDTTRTTVLGHNNEGKTNFIRIRQDEGYLYLNLNPLAFTNYNLVMGNNYEYVFKCLSYLPIQNTYWNEFYKLKNSTQRSSIEYILSRKSLRYAWYLFLTGIVLFFVFQSRRTHRAIPVLTPLTNTTLSFIETIGRLYFSRKNHLDIAQKRFLYFIEFIRSRYYIEASETHNEMVHKVVEKSGIPKRTVQQIFDMGSKMGQMKKLSEADLEQFNKHLEYFYSNSR
jgi:hypothetical protein